MAKGSQLVQLKTALHKAGITGNQNTKKRKRTSQEGDKEKKAAKLAEIHRKLNPFDVKVTKLKHDVGGRKLKGVKGKPAESKMAGIEQRKKTLLKEYEERGHAGGVLDRRFGENDPTMSLEERMLERFTRERQHATKSSVFNLEDDEELTHYGQSLSKLDDFDDVGLESQDDDDGEATGQLDGEVVRKAHFSGFADEEDEDEPPRKKSKAEVMSEVIAKSKEHKMLRQIEKEHGENVRHELDQAYDSLRNLLHAPTAGTNGISPEQPADLIDGLQTGGAEYDQHVRELAFDKRAKPKDRTKTEEELALEEKEALEKAERQRKKRMLGLDDDDSNDEDAGSRKRRRRSGDDLDDDFDNGEDHDWADFGPTLQETDMKSDDDESTNGEWASSDSDDDSDSGQEDSEPSSDEQHQDINLSVQTPKSSTKSTAELPYTFPCPSTHEELLSILQDVEDEDVPIVIQRIRTLHHTSFAPENKSKLQILSSVLIEHILYLASSLEPHLAVLQSLIPPLGEITQAYPMQCAEFYVQKLSLMHKNLKRGLARGPLDPTSKTWPAFAELTFLRVVGIIWPTSDMSHTVISPTRLLMAAYLGLGRVRSLSDVASGLFLCTLFLQYEKLSKRFVPEVINFLVNSVLHLAPHHFNDVSAVPGSFPIPDFRSEPCKPLQYRPGEAPEELRKPNLCEMLSKAQATEASKASLLNLTLDLLGRYAELYKSLEGFIELYTPISEIIEGIEKTKLPQSLQSRLDTLMDMFMRLLKFANQGRQPLRLQSHKAIPIPSYVPKFEMSSSSYLRRQDPDHERNELSKLRYQYKQERKGAIRELRKDARFLAGVQQKKQAEKDRAYNERMKRVFGTIESERAEQKAMDREKAKEKRRAGRKH